MEEIIPTGAIPTGAGPDPGTAPTVPTVPTPPAPAAPAATPAPAQPTTPQSVPPDPANPNLDAANLAAREQIRFWASQGAAVRARYPRFDLSAELRDPRTGQRFFGLLHSGVDVRTAYEVVHQQEILDGAMRAAAQAVSQKLVNDIRARGLRPPENGGSGAAASLHLGPDASTRAGREEIARRVLRGERIVL